MLAHQPSQEKSHRTIKGAQRIQDLKIVATELFLERGFEAVAVDDLINRVGGSRRNIYSYFGGKEGLFIECVRQLCTELGQPLQLLNIKEDEPRKALQAFGHALLAIVLQPRTLELHRLMIAEGKRFPELAQAVFHAGHAQSADILSNWINTHRKKHLATQENTPSARSLAEQFVSMIVMEVQLQALIGLTPIPLTKKNTDYIVNSAVSTFLNAANL